MQLMRKTRQSGTRLSADTCHSKQPLLFTCLAVTNKGHEDTVQEAAFASSQVMCARLNTRMNAIKIYRHLKFCILVDGYTNMRCIQNVYNFGRSSLWRCVQVLHCISSDCISLVLRNYNHTNHTVSLLLKH